MNEQDAAFVEAVTAQVRMREYSETNRLLVIIREQEAELAALREERRERPMSERPKEGEELMALFHVHKGRVDEYAQGRWWPPDRGYTSWEAGLDVTYDVDDCPIVGWLPMPTPKEVMP